ncbi:MAG: hypothetical protein EPO22_05965 [Dehalococcoidia bacterium]|nr:MAG: hypothetical protein EPO22_05965 [Dehalococcoidia bacterium]
MMGVSARRFARCALLGVVAVAVAASACSDGDSTPAAASPTAAAADAIPTLDYGTPKAPPPTPLPVERGVDDTSDGIGVYPAVVTFPNALRGREYFGTVGIMNGGPRERTYRFEAKGDAASWLAFVAADRTTALAEVTVPAHDKTQVLIRAVVPPEVPNGQYGGTVGVLTSTTTREGSDTSGAGVTLGAEVSVALAVTGTQKIEGQFIDAAASDVESGYPLRIATRLTNTGNVQLNATIDVQILDAAGQPVDHFTSTDQPLYPSDDKQVIAEWDTTGRATGERIGRVSVALGWLPLGTKDVRFNILPPGTYTRRGELADVRLVNKPRAGDYAKLVAVFRNTGQIETKGKFIGELYLGDRLIEQLTSTEQLLLPGGEGDLDLLVRVPEDGAYRVTGKINYEGRETDAHDYTFRVGDKGGRPWLLIGGIAAVAATVVAAGGAAGVWRWRRRGRPAI